jgi:rhodanese-related sulfurtransferase
MKNSFKILGFILFLLPTSLTAEIVTINNSQISALMKENVPLIDVRREEEWKSTGIIKNSNLITFFDKEGKYDFIKFLSELNKIENIEKGLILFCRTGRRTTIIAQALEKTGKFKNIYNTKGIKAWNASKYPLTKYKN